MNRLIVKCAEKNIQLRLKKIIRLNPASRKLFAISIIGLHGPDAQKHVVVEKELETETVLRILVVENHHKPNCATRRCVCHSGLHGLRQENAQRKSFISIIHIG